MQIKWQHIVLLLVAFIAGWYLSQRKKVVKVKTIYDTRVDTITIDSIVYDTDTLILPQSIDTAAVVEAFYTKRKIDTTIISNEVKIKFTGSLYENTLRNVVFQTQNLRPTQVVQEMTWSISGGVTAGRNVLAPTIYSQYANHELGVGYNLIGEGGILLTYKYTFFRP